MMTFSADAADKIAAGFTPILDSTARGDASVIGWAKTEDEAAPVLRAHFAGTGWSLVRVERDDREFQRYGQPGEREMIEAFIPVTEEDDASAISEGDRIEAGKPGTEDYDTGTVLEINGDRAFIGWNSGVQTWAQLADLRPL